MTPSLLTNPDVTPNREHSHAPPPCARLDVPTGTSFPSAQKNQTDAVYVLGVPLIHVELRIFCESHPFAAGFTRVFLFQSS